LVTKRLIQNSICQSTKKSYIKSANKFNNFVNYYYHKDCSFPVNFTHLQQFVAFLHCAKIQPSSVQTILSAINFIQKSVDGPDIFQHFFINRIMMGYKKLSISHSDARQPITVDILFQLCSAINHISTCTYTKILIQSMFLLSFYALLRVGEITVTSQLTPNPNLLMRDNLSICPSTGQVTVIFTAFKHSVPGSPTTLVISPNSGLYSLPITLANYLRQRGSLPGPLFLYKKAAVSRNFYNNILQQCLKFIGLDQSKYKTHSFRIGSATSAAERGISALQLQHMGRWRSNAYQKYIRIHSFKI